MARNVSTLPYLTVPLAGRFLFGASAVLFGVIALMWRDADTWQSLYAFRHLPLGMFVGEVLMITLIAGGIGVVFPQTARASATVLCIVYAPFTLACVPAIIFAPTRFDPYDGFSEQLSLLCGAIALYAATHPDRQGSARLERIARVGYGLSAIAFTLAQAVYLRVTAQLVPPWLPPNQTFWAIATTVAFAFAAGALLTGIQARLAIRLTTLMLVIFGVVVWIPQLIAQPASHGNWSEFALTLLIAGAAWTVGDALSSARESVSLRTRLARRA